MSSTQSQTAASAAFLRRLAVSAAVQPLLEGLESRSLFSATPTANPGGAYAVNQGQNVTVSGLGSTDSDGHVVSYAWDTNYDASKGFKTRVTSGTWTFHADTSGPRTVALRVTDDSGDVSTVATTTINVADVAPTLTLTAPAAADEASKVDIAFSATDPGPADAVTGWSVAWGDGSTTAYDAASNAGHHVYSEDGNYGITLTATQAGQANRQTSVSHAITINNVAPVVEATSPRTDLDEGETAILFFNSPNRATTLDGWSINWGDGTSDVLESGRNTAQHVYADNGNYHAKSYALEPDGGNGFAEVVYNVGNVAPDVTQTGAPTTGLEGTAITVGSTVHDAGVNDTESYGWTVYRNGDAFVLPGGTDQASPSFTFTPTDNGSYVVRLTVTDKDGGATTVNSAPIVVANVDPTATITGTPVAAINEGDTVALTAHGVDVGAEDTLTYAWSVSKDGQNFVLPDGTDASHAGFNFVPTDNGSYIATVVVTDKDGGHVSVATSAITVNNVAPVATAIAPATANEGDTVTATSTVVDPGSVDTQGYAWGVEKLVGGSNGTLTVAGTSSAEMNPYDFGDSFTVTTRIDLTSLPADGEYSLIRDFTHASSMIGVVKSGADLSVVLRNFSSGQSATTGAVLPASGFFDLAVTFDNTTGAAAVYVDGNAVTLSNGNIGTGFGGSNRHTHFAQGLYAVLDQVGVYHDALSPTDVASLHNDAAIATPAYDLWNFSEAAGTHTMDSEGTNHSGFYINGTYSGTATWVPYVLPAGVSTTDSTFAFVPADNGTYRAKLTVTDKDGGVSNTQTSNIVVANVAPVAAITGDDEGTEGGTLNYSVAVTDPGSLDTQSYVWSVTKDGNAYTNGLGATNAQAFSFTPDDDAAYVVSVQVTDKDGGVGTMSHNVNVLNAAPVVAITGAPATGTEGQQISVGSNVIDAGLLDTHAYAWSVTKDGTAVDLSGVTTTDPTFAFTPADNGSYVITLAVVDNGGMTGLISSSAVLVDNVDPTGTVTGEPGSAIDEGGTVNLTATGSDVAADAATLAYAWTIKKDGQAFTPLAGTVLNTANLTFVPTDNGSYVATVAITDKDNGSVSVDSQAIAVNNVAPVASIDGPSTGVEGTAFTMTSTSTDAGAADVLSYAWSVTKDGNPITLTHADTTGQTFNFKPRDNGAYVITLAVSDDDGATTTTSANVTVANANPVPTISGDDTVDENHPITLAVAANDPGVNDTQSYLWSVTKNGNAYTTGVGTTTAAGFTFTPNLYGTYVVTAQVTDKDGGVGTVSKTITVNDVAPTNVTITGTPTGARAEGSPLNFHGTASDVPAETGLTYSWSVTRNNGQVFNLPIGAVTNTQDFEFTPTHSGKYKVSLAVTDSGGKTTTASTSVINITNALPDAAMTGVPTGPINEGTAVALHVDATDPGTEDVLSYKWTVTKNGQAYTLPDGVVTTTADFAFTPGGHGSFVATCVVTDDVGGPTSVNSGAITVNDVAPTAAITFAPSGSVDEGSTVNVAGTATDPGTSDVLSYKWTVTKDGQAYAASVASPAGQSYSFVPSDNGTYVVTLVANDGTLDSNVASSTVVVNNVAPTGTISGPTTGTEGVALKLTAAGADAGSIDAASLTYAWSVTKDGQAVTLPGDVVANAAAFNYTPANNGAYVFSVAIGDKDGGSTTLTQNVAVANVAPTVTMGQTPTNSVEGSPVTFSATASDVPADTLAYGWTVYKSGQHVVLPQGTAIDGQSFTFTPTDDGSYTVRLTVQDGDGGEKTVNSPLAVSNAAPAAAITGDTTGTEGGQVSLGSTATDAPDDQAAGFGYAWTVKLGGKTVATGTDATLKFTPAVHGVYAVSLAVTDKDGLTTTTASQVNVANVAPTNVALAGNLSGISEGQKVQLTASATDASGDVVSYGWKVMNGNTVFASGTGTNVNFTAARGGYVITVTATDTAGAATSRSYDLAVANVAPTAALTAPTATVQPGQSASFGLTYGDVPATQALAVTWDYGDGSTPATATYAGTGVATTAHTFAARGTYTVKATISDGIDTTVVTKTVTVSEVSMVADPMDASKTALVVNGSAGDDTIVVSQSATGAYGVTFNGVSLGDKFAPTGRVYVYGQGGSNTINVGGAANAVVFAGTSSTAASNVTTGGGNDVIVGSPAGDRLNAGDGKDVVIGAAGQDILHGNAGDDLLITGSTSWMNDLPTLNAVDAIWTGNSKIATRRGNLGTYFTGKQLINDSGNQVFGEDGNDWMVINANADKIKDLQSGDLVN